MRYEDISPLMRAWLGAACLYYKLGFRSGDIYLELAGSAAMGGKLAAFATLKTQGREFRIECGLVEDAKAFQEEYQRVAAASKDIHEEDLERIWEEGPVAGRATQAILAIMNKGLEIPGRGGN